MVRCAAEVLVASPGAAPPEVYVVGENGYIDLAPLVRELAMLDMPMQPLCRPDCHGLCMTCGQNLNEKDCDCETEEIDPRLVALRDLLD